MYKLKESVKTGNVEVMERTWKDKDNILHKMCELKVIKKTVIKSYNRLTTIIVILIFLLILTVFLWMIITRSNSPPIEYYRSISQKVHFDQPLLVKIAE